MQKMKIVRKILNILQLGFAIIFMQHLIKGILNLGNKQLYKKHNKEYYQVKKLNFR
jgi:hypothetical protein